MRAWHVNSTDHQYPLITAAKSIIGAPPSLSNHCRGVLRCNFLLWAFVAAKRRNATTSDARPDAIRAARRHTASA